MKLKGNGRGVLIVALSLIVAVSAQADIEEGDWELRASGGFFHAQDSDTGTISADVSLGYFLTPGWEVGITQGINSNLVDGGDDTYTATTAPFIVYNFHDHDSLNDKFIPFLGVFGGGVWNDNDFTGTVGPTAGLKAFIHEKTFFLTQYRYEWYFDDLELSSFKDDFDTVEENSSDGNHVLTVGFGVLW